jgi:hypothetical protein
MIGTTTIPGGQTYTSSSSTKDETVIRESETPSSTTNAVGSTTLVVAMPGTQPSDDNIALIGGIVGGVVALLIAVGVIAFIVSRNRRKAAQDQPSNRNDVSMAPAQASSSNYGRISAQPASNHYDESFLSHSTATQHYDDAGVLTNNTYGIANANQTNYDDSLVLSH